MQISSLEKIAAAERRCLVFPRVAKQALQAITGGRKILFSETLEAEKRAGWTRVRSAAALGPQPSGDRRAGHARTYTIGQVFIRAQEDFFM